jgi:chemotaxis protein methyltransferase CheR
MSDISAQGGGLTSREAKEREFDFTDEDFQFIRDMVVSHAGIKLADSKREMVYGRLSRRLRQVGLASFAEYCALLQEKPDEELGSLINAITTNLTSFFREKYHFEYMADTLGPLFEKTKVHDRRVRIWSAGCSTGAEPYSIAITAREVWPAERGWDVKILATDIDTNVLQTAADGIYDQKEVAEIPDARIRRWFMRGKDINAGSVRVKQELRNMIAFRQLNLLGPWSMSKSFDIIFCRNVVIYFDKDTQRTLFSRFADMLAPEAHLFIGHSESLARVCDRFKLVGQTTYRKTE